jgi:4-diphosphocytidyl-2C-methyl-D-erythritol kinase
LLAAPPAAVSTAAVYGAVTPAAYADDASPLWDTLSRLGEPPAVWWPRGVNSLEPVAARLYPALSELKASVAELGFDGARLSGSGGAYAAPAPDARRAADAVRELQRRGYWATVTTTA